MQSLARDSQHPLALLKIQPQLSKLPYPTPYDQVLQTVYFHMDFRTALVLDSDFLPYMYLHYHFNYCSNRKVSKRQRCSVMYDVVAVSIPQTMQLKCAHGSQEEAWRFSVMVMSLNIIPLSH